VRLACVSTILGYPWGSPDRLWSGLAGRCLWRGDSVLLAISAKTADSAAVRSLRDVGAQVFLRERNSVFLGYRDRWLRKFPGRRERHLEFQLRKFRPDVVVITQGGTHDSLAETYLTEWLESSGTPYVAICHNNTEGRELLALERERVARFLVNAPGLLFVSSHNLELVERQLGIGLPHGRLIQNPLAIEDPGRLRWSGPDGRARLGLVGRIDILHKGIDLLFEALASLKQNFSFQVALTGRCEAPGRVEALIRRFGIDEQVSVRPPVAAAGVVQCYQSMELFVLTSRYEGCASAMLEALMCARPVLATPVGGVSDWIEDGISGFVAPAITVPAIRDTLVRALSQRAAWPAMGEVARQRFIARRDPDPVRALLAIVDNVASSSNLLPAHA